MTLVEHLRELRNRILKTALAILVLMIVAWYFYEPLFHLLREPVDEAIAQLNSQRHTDIKIVIPDVAGALTLKLKICLVAAIVAGCPVWLYQAWAFVVPAMHANERKWAMGFLCSAVPLFLGGVALGYSMLPRALGVLFGFTPAGVANYPQLGTYLTFTLRLLLVTGLAFELPVFMVLLHLVGLLSVQRLRKWRRHIIFGLFVFAAVASPPDAFTMMIIAVPMLALYAASEVAIHILERRKRERLAAQGIDLSLSDDDE